MSHEGVLKWATWIFFSSSLCLESFSFTLTSPFDEEKDYIDVFLVIGSAPTMVIVWDARWKSINLCSYHFCSEWKDFWEYIFIWFLVRTISHMCIVEKGWPRSTFWGFYSHCLLHPLTKKLLICMTKFIPKMSNMRSGGPLPRWSIRLKFGESPTKEKVGCLDCTETFKSTTWAKYPWVTFIYFQNIILVGLAQQPAFWLRKKQLKIALVIDYMGGVVCL